MGNCTGLKANKKNKNTSTKKKLIQFTDILEQNLLKNPSGYEDFKYWHSEILSLNTFNPSGSQFIKALIDSYNQNYQEPNRKYWKIETNPTNCDQLIVDNKNIDKNFVTSFQWGSKMQLIELSAKHLDLISKCLKENIELKLIISENYTSRIDCGSVYKLEVSLVNSNFEMVDACEMKDELWSDGKWKSFTHEFKIRKPFKYIIFNHAGKDSEYLAGYFGCKITNGSVRFSVN